MLGCQSTSQKTTSDNLNESPRHHEWVQVNNNGKIIHCWVAYPERKEKTPVVLVIHENRGLNDWARSFADQVAEAGYIAIAPDLLSSFSDSLAKTSDFASTDAARDAIYQLTPEQVTADLNAVFQYAKEIPAGNGKLVTAGFCWGGSQSFRYATQQADLTAAMVFYGTAPKDGEGLDRISCPVYGFYGGDDNRVNATIAASDSVMKSLNKPYDYLIYEGAGHAYMRRGEDPEGGEANIKAREESWKRLKSILAGI